RRPQLRPCSHRGQICTQVTADNVAAVMAEDAARLAGLHGVLPGWRARTHPERRSRASGPAGPWM
ncbi:MAG: hypothetical protein ACLQDY_21745, partial [Streptosporangiaceae bacterium]